MKNIKSVTVKNGDISLTVAEYGATILSLTFKGKEMTLGYGDTEEYKRQDGYLGATVGRFANRIAKGEFYLNGEKYVLYKNDGNNTLHGGRVGFNAVLWDLTVKDCLPKPYKQGTLDKMPPQAPDNRVYPLIPNYQTKSGAFYDTAFRLVEIVGVEPATS